MMSKFVLFPILLSYSVVISCSDKKIEPVDYVNPYMGNISHLLVPTYPTVNLPNSLMRFYPNRDNYTSNNIQGFPLNVVSHRSGKVFNLSPYEGDAKGINETTLYTYDNEIITPYSYSVTLDESDIDVKFIPAERSGFFSFHFNEGNDQAIILKTTNQGELSFENNSITGYDTFNEVKAYLYLEFDRKPENVKVRERDIVSDNTSVKGNRIAIIAGFNDGSTSEIKIRYGLSYISAEQARKNLQNDISGWDIKKMSDKAREKWNSALSKIEIEGGSENQRRVFYTSLYRCFERMVNITEDGQYFSIWSNKVEPSNDTAFYTDDWVWDTHLALHPLQVILNPDNQDEKITSYIRMARQSGWMPTFPTISGDNHAMNGNHSAAVFLDAWNKGIRNFDLEEAYDHLKNTILHETKLPWVRDSSTWLDAFYDKKGYFPALRKDEPETCPKVHSFEKRQAVAITLASSYDDWCMAQMAKELGKDDDYSFFLRRSLNYRNLFKNDTGFYHPKDSAGNWIEPFDYRYDGGMGARDYYDENNGWTYIWQPYHAFEDLIKMMGGPEKFEKKLDRLFTEGLGKSKWQYYSTMPDATGNVGQFVMGNEPSMHIAYLYNLAGKPWKTQKRVRMLMDTWFRNDLMGVPGDEDGGGLSAFYVFSAMGFYPITPGVPEYQIGSPLFNRIKIRLQNGNIFTVTARNNSAVNKYIQSAKLNGKKLTKPVFTHTDLSNGGMLILEMGSKPDKMWGTLK
jgi:predicted alpha-1,2-mannosidase